MTSIWKPQKDDRIRHRVTGLVTTVLGDANEEMGTVEVAFNGGRHTAQLAMIQRAYRPCWAGTEPRFGEVWTRKALTL